MASLPSSLPFSFLSLFIVFPTLPVTLSQEPIFSNPIIAQCSTSLLPLVSCAPFVQGLTMSPTIPCCDNLIQLYDNAPHCLCLVLNQTNLASFPINSTRALMLPRLCSLRIDVSTCSGSGVLVPSNPPNTQVSPGAGDNTNSTVSVTNATVSASPMAQPASKPSIVGLGMGRISASFKPKAGIEFTAVIALKAFLFLSVVY